MSITTIIIQITIVITCNNRIKGSRQVRIWRHYSLPPRGVGGWRFSGFLGVPKKINTVFRGDQARIF